MAGIAPEYLRQMLPWTKKLSWTVLIHVVAQDAIQNRSVKADTPSAERHVANLPKYAFEGMLSGLRGAIMPDAIPVRPTMPG